MFIGQLVGEDARAARSPRRHFPQPIGHRGVRQRHAGSDGVRPAGGRRGRHRRDQPGPVEEHRHVGRPGDTDGYRRCSRSLCPRRPSSARSHGAAGLAFAKTRTGTTSTPALRRSTSASSSARAADAMADSAAYFSRSIRCAASSRISVISCTSASSKPSWRNPVAQRSHQIADRPPDRRMARAVLAGAASSSRSNKASTSSAFSSRWALAFLGHGKRLARSLGRLFLDQPHVGQHRQRRIDHPRARRIIAAGELLDRADQIIAVARLVGDQLQQDQSKLARSEHPPAPARPARPRRRDVRGRPSPKSKWKPLGPKVMQTAPPAE